LSHTHTKTHKDTQTHTHTHSLTHAHTYTHSYTPAHIQIRRAQWVLSVFLDPRRIGCAVAPCQTTLIPVHRWRPLFSTPTAVPGSAAMASPVSLSLSLSLSPSLPLSLSLSS